MQKVILASCFSNKTELTRGRFHLIHVPRVGDYMKLPENGHLVPSDKVLKIEALEWQVPIQGKELAEVEIYGTLMTPTYKS